ncbi:MAG: hypothetical protein WCI36_05700 [bacterium]
MKNRELSSRDYQIFLLKSLLWLGLAWSSFAFALAGFFYASLIWITVGAFGIWLTKRAKDLRVRLKPSRELFFASIATLLVAIVFSAFSGPSVFTGRDQGSFTEAAVRLAQNHKLEFSTPTSDEFFKLHQPGKALNFPGFYYTKNGDLITQFSLVYISWLALFFAVFGTLGFAIANGLLLYTFFLSFYLLLRLFLKTTTTIPIMLLTTTSFVFMWFSKMNLSENMALPLLWVAILSLTLFLKNQRNLYYFIFLFSIILICFTRIEGFAFLIAAIAILALNEDAKTFIKEKLQSRLFFPIGVLLLALIANTFVDIYFYKEILKALLPQVKTPQAQYLGSSKHNILPTFYFEKVFYLYGLLGFFAISAISVAYKLWNKEFYRLMPFFITIPTFIYLFDSQITPDHPWMLRRFMFSIAPVAIFYTGMFLGRLYETKSDTKNNTGKVAAIAIFAILLAMNMPAFSKYLTYSENKNMLAQTEALASKFTANDLVLIDQKASGDGWSMISGPMNFLYAKNAVYFFNIQDLSKLDTSKFSNVYLISPDTQVSFYLHSTIGKRLTQIDSYNLQTTRLDIKDVTKIGDVILPDQKNVTVTGKIFKLAK